jgi:hypothetical protein
MFIYKCACELVFTGTTARSESLGLKLLVGVGRRVDGWLRSCGNTPERWAQLDDIICQKNRILSLTCRQCQASVHVTPISSLTFAAAEEDLTTLLINVTISSDMLLYQCGRRIIVEHLSSPYTASVSLSILHPYLILHANQRHHHSRWRPTHE